MKQRLIDNWKSTVIGIFLLAFSCLLVWFDKMTWTEFGVFLPTIIGFLWVKDTVFKASGLPVLFGILFIQSLLWCSGCKEIQYIPVETVTEIRDRVDTVKVPADSSSYYAWLGCDSLNRVYIKQLREVKSNTVTQSFILDNNNLKVKFNSQPLPITVTVHDTITVKQVPVKVPGPTVEIYKMRWYQETFMYIGIFLLIIIIIIVAWKILAK